MVSKYVVGSVHFIDEAKVKGSAPAIQRQFFQFVPCEQ